MLLENLINNILPKTYSHFDQIRAATIVITSLAVSTAMILLVLYWVVTQSFETKKTIFAALGIILLLVLCVGLAISGQVNTGGWILVLIMILLNFANMLGYGISTSASAGYILPILLAMFCIGPGAGYAVAIFGCVFVFTIPILHSKERFHFAFPYKTSSITFDAPTLTLIYLLTAVITGSWVFLVKNMFVE